VRKNYEEKDLICHCAGDGIHKCRKVSIFNCDAAFHQQFPGNQEHPNFWLRFIKLYQEVMNRESMATNKYN
jgi:hypothetical protein